MLSRFAPNDIVIEEFKTISFNRLLLYNKGHKMYHVIFLPLLRACQSKLLVRIYYRLFQ